MGQTDGQRDRAEDSMRQGDMSMRQTNRWGQDGVPYDPQDQFYAPSFKQSLGGSSSVCQTHVLQGRPIGTTATHPKLLGSRLLLHPMSSARRVH